MALVPQTRGMVLSIGLPVRRRGGLYNTACIVADGQIAGFAAKEHLAGEGLHYEPRWFKPWPNHQVVELERDGRSYPFGDVFFDFSGVRVGFEICEDAWVAQRRGAIDGHAMDIIVNPSASHFAFGKHEVRERHRMTCSIVQLAPRARTHTRVRLCSCLVVCLRTRGGQWP